MNSAYYDGLFDPDPFTSHHDKKPPVFHSNIEMTAVWDIDNICRFVRKIITPYEHTI
jgi:hypothetical protein